MNLIPNIKQNASLLIIPALFAIFLFSCKKDGKVAVNNNTLIIGKWYIKNKAVKRVLNGVTIEDKVYTDFNNANYQFKMDNTVTVLTETGNVFTIPYTLVGDSLTYIHTESQDYYGAKERFRIKKVTNTDMELSYLPKDNEPYLTPPEGTYIEMILSK
ncbi:hypothetical protein [Mucilaginibacter aquariorum]|uniref:Lipocalin-like domain-containing protein n=1 Tax=Mucilaginibacter aquariorum TaxID=2967225 RepID=A0ABT1T2F0_9SPHI|nr:hypothetical protein [Mucilaginibacter aquariorum]MCQ6958785.1 hypothetical protein [Mucilaginibacter aquariorum]